MSTATLSRSRRQRYVAERFAFALAPGSRIDREKEVIEGVRIVGLRSRNGRKYPAAVLAAQAHLYAAPVNVGHHYAPGGERPAPVPPAARFGRIEDPKADGKGIVGTLLFNPEHGFARPFVWACKNDPGQYAFSPLHSPRWAAESDADGDMVAESILAVASVDIVSDGGTTSTVFEHLGGEDLMDDAVMVDPAGVGGLLTDVETAAAFLGEMFDASPLTPDDVAEVLSRLAAGLAAGLAAVPGAVSESRRRKLGWGFDQILRAGRPASAALARSLAECYPDVRKAAVMLCGDAPPMTAEMALAGFGGDGGFIDALLADPNTDLIDRLLGSAPEFNRPGWQPPSGRTAPAATPASMSADIDRILGGFLPG